MRIYFGIVLLIAFVLWTLYRLLIKKDLKQHMDTFKLLAFFVIVWAVIYVGVIYW